jgi:hypothetical protein
MFRQMPNGEYKWLGVGAGVPRGVAFISRSPGDTSFSIGRRAPQLRTESESKKYGRYN